MSTAPTTNREIWLIRHGETAWSLSGQHTGRTDLPLTEQGREHARLLGRRLRSESFDAVFSSPLERARETCELSGIHAQPILDEDLQEWDYGGIEGRTTAEIREELGDPEWTIWKGSPLLRETPADVAGRAARALERITPAGGRVAVFAHGHYLRILATVWLGLPPETAQSLLLSTTSLSVLGHERGRQVLQSWNQPWFLVEDPGSPPKPHPIATP